MTSDASARPTASPAATFSASLGDDTSAASSSATIAAMSLPCAGKRYVNTAPDAAISAARADVADCAPSIALSCATLRSAYTRVAIGATGRVIPTSDCASAFHRSSVVAPPADAGSSAAERDDESGGAVGLSAQPVESAASNNNRKPL